MEYKQNRTNTQLNPITPIKTTWIQEEGITKESIEWAKTFAESIATKGFTVTPSQLRRFFGEVRRIETNSKRDPVYLYSNIVMLSPMLAYAAGKDKNKEKDNCQIKIFYKIINEAITFIRPEKAHIFSDFRNFVLLLEAIVAYHKYFSKKQ